MLHGLRELLYGLENNWLPSSLPQTVRHVPRHCVGQPTIEGAVHRRSEGRNVLLDHCNHGYRGHGTLLPRVTPSRQFVHSIRTPGVNAAQSVLPIRSAVFLCANSTDVDDSPAQLLLRVQVAPAVHLLVCLSPPVGDAWTISSGQGTVTAAINGG